MMILEPLTILAAIIGLCYLEGCLKTWSGIPIRKMKTTKQSSEMVFERYGYL